MTLPATVVLSQIMSVSLCSVPAAITLPDENTLQQEIGKIVGKAIQEIRGKDAPKVVGRGPIKAAQNAAGRSEQDIQKFNERLQAYGGVSSAWIVKSCELTAEQQIKLKEILMGNSFERQRSLRSRRMPKVNAKGYLGRCLCFSRCPSDQGQTLQSKSSRPSGKDLLTEEQTQRLETALSEREVFRTKAYLSYIVAIVDGELFLTSSQREALHNQLTSQWTTLYQPFYAFSPEVDCMPYKSVLTILKESEGKSFWESSQQKRLQDVSHSQQNSQHLIIGSAAGPDEWVRDYGRRS